MSFFLLILSRSGSFFIPFSRKFLSRISLDLSFFACMLSGFRFSCISLVNKSNFEGDQRRFVNVSLLQGLDLCSFNLFTLLGDNVGDAKLTRVPPKGKAIAIDGDLSVCSLPKTDSVIGH